MTTMITEVYDAFKAAGVPDDTAEAAAKAVCRSADTRDRRIRIQVAPLLLAEPATPVSQMQSSEILGRQDSRTSATVSHLPTFCNV